jgi:hypothetical protein
MEAYELLKQLETVKAPPNFEQKLMAQLSLRKRKQVRRRTVRFSLAGAFTGALVLLLVINFFILPGRGPVPYSASERSVLSDRDWGNALPVGDTIRIIEPVDYSSEIRTLSNEVPTVYILEQVAWTADTKIRY